MVEAKTCGHVLMSQTVGGHIRQPCHQLKNHSGDCDFDLPATLKVEYFEIQARELVWGILYDDCTLDQWYGVLKSVETGHWANGKHDGDCTRQPMTCHRCLFEEIDKFSKPIAAALLKASGK